MTRTWTLAGAFDAGHIRGWTPGWTQELNFHQLEMTGHGTLLEDDYRLFREEFGLTSFRDGAWLARTYRGDGQFDWTYLDRLAGVSQGQVSLSLCHYEWPPWIEEEDVWSGRVVDLMAEYAGRLAERYRGRFGAYIPVVESGYWTAMMTDWGRWWPAGKGTPKRSWWEMYAVVGRMLVAMARAVKAADPDAAIALNEPWAWHPDVSLRDQARPFFTLSGAPDPVAVRETGSENWGGDPSLLQIVGLNFYNNWGVDQGWPLHRLLLEARRHFPSQRIMMGETGNCHFPDRYRAAEWLHLIDDEVEQANAQGAAVEAVTWAPILTLGDFDWGRPAPGSWVNWDPNDPKRRRFWDPETAQIVRQFAGSPSQSVSRSTAQPPRPAPGSKGESDRKFRRSAA